MIRRWMRFLAAGTFEGWRGQKDTGPTTDDLADLATWWHLKQQLAAPAHFYGDGGTIHHTGHLDVETYEGNVVAVWFRCAMLPFEQVRVGDNRATEMLRVIPRSRITGIEILDQPAAS